jgi:mannose-1-phosphate guanylyltransferase
MAGGRGTRFWPESRNAMPKQFLAMFGRKTLLEETVDRLAPVVSKSHIFVVTQKDKTGLVRKKIHAPASRVLGEPVGRNTAPCMIYAAALIARKDPKAVLAMLPADNRIENVPVFRRALKAAYAAASKEGLPVTFGIRPGYPHTGYGYLEMGKEACRAGGFKIYRLKRFHEKPNLPRAKAFFNSGKFLWNSGMFVWRADRLLETARKFLPEAYELARFMTEKDAARRLEKYFHKMPNISIDYGLMEKLGSGILTLPVDIGWSDVGGWKTLAELLGKPGADNVLVGDVVPVRSRGNFVKMNGRMAALVGVQNLVVIDTPDALLVCAKDQTEAIREVVDEIKRRDWNHYL